MNKKSPPHQQNIFQNQSKQTKNGEAHGGVRQDKYADSGVYGASDQPSTLPPTYAYARRNTKSHRAKKHSKKRRLSQLATWAEDPIVFKIRQKAQKRNLSVSETIRKLLIKALKDEESVDEALDTESLRESVKRDNNRLARRLSWLLVWPIYDVGQMKVLTTNTLGMQKGMTEEMLKDILRDADRQTKARFSRKRPELGEFADAIEQWLTAAEDAEHGGETNPDSNGANGHNKRGGRGF